MRQSITTNYMPYTNTKPSRIKAQASGGEALTIPYDHELGADANHAKAAQALATKLDWKGVWVAGGLTRGNSFVGLGPHVPVTGAAGVAQYLGIMGVDWFNVL